MNKSFSLSSKKIINEEPIKEINASPVIEDQPSQLNEELPIMSNDTQKQDVDVTEIQQEESISEIEPLVKPIEPPTKSLSPEIKEKETKEDSSKEEKIYNQLPEPISVRLKKYKLHMMPGKSHHGDTGAKEQVSLYRAIQAILRTQGSDFFKHLNAFLDFIHLHRNTLFNEKYAMRYFDVIKLNDKERKGFSRILHLFIITSDRKVRKQALKQVDLETVLSPFSEEVKEKITEFYSI